MPLSVGVIGCGNIARFHFAGLERFGARVAWACDTNEAAARPWVEKLEAKYTADYRQVLSDPAVQAVFVTTATRFHKQICLDAIAARKAVVCEKTLADSAVDAAEIVRAAEAADLVCFLFGRPRTVFAEVSTPPDRDYDLRASAMMRTDLCPVHFDALAHPHERAGFLADGWDEQIEIIGLRGRLHVYSAMWDQPEHKGSILVHHDSAAGTTTEHRFDLISPFTRAVDFYCRNIEAGSQGTQPRSTGYDVDVLIEAFLQSSDQKGAVGIEYAVD
ncbi:MAG TPA: Gfo/Idh/MocA family oxidoreductase [Tepidisphaeraceae bacterium]